MKKSVLLVLMSAVSLTSFSLCAGKGGDKDEGRSTPFRRPSSSPVAFDEAVYALQMGPQCSITINDDEYSALNGFSLLNSTPDLIKREQIKFLPSVGSGVKWIYFDIARAQVNEVDYVTLRFTATNHPEWGKNSTSNLPHRYWHEEKKKDENSEPPIRTVNFLLKKI